MTKFLHIDSLWLFRHSVVMVIESELYKTCCRAKKKLNSWLAYIMDILVIWWRAGNSTYMTCNRLLHREYTCKCYVQSNLDLRTPLFTYFRFMYYFVFNELLHERTRIWYRYFEYVNQSTYIEFEYIKQSTYIKFEYVLRVILSFQFCKFFDLLFWVRHADEWQSTCSNSIEREKNWWLQLHFTVRFISFSKVWF
jgi:hypothetical protein